MELGGTALYLAVFAAAFAEATAFLGLLVPGVGIVLAAGLLAARGQADPFWVGAWAALGSTGGFWLSYHLGRAGGARIARWTGRARATMDRAAGFFRRYGAWSILLSHFFGPVRALVPLVAGASALSPGRFWPASIIGAVAWGYGLTLVGAVVSGGWELVEAQLGRASLVVALFAVLLYVAVRIATGVVLLGIRLLPPAASVASRSLWRIRLSLPFAALLRRYPGLGGWISRRLDPDHATGLVLTLGALASLTFAWVFFGIWDEFGLGEPLSQIDRHIFHLLQLMRTHEADRLFVALTELGGTTVVASIVLAAIAALFFLHRRFEALLFPVAFAAGDLVVSAVKQLLGRARPVVEIPVVLEHSGSFPSGHAFTATVLYGFLAYLASRPFSPKARVRLYTAASVLILSVGVSRLYLGVHWVRDVVAGHALGGIWLSAIVTAVEIRQRFGAARPPLALRKAWAAAVLTAAAMLAAWAGTAMVNTGQGSAPANPYSNSEPVLQDGFSETAIAMAEFPVESVTGRNLGAVQAVVSGPGAVVAAAASDRGWVNTRALDMSGLLGQLAQAFRAAPAADAPAGLLFWRGRPQEMSFAFPTAGGRRIVRLWSTGYSSNTMDEIWVCWERFHPAHRRFLGISIPARAQPADIGDFVAALTSGGGFIEMPRPAEASPRLIARRVPPRAGAGSAQPGQTGPRSP